MQNAIRFLLAGGILVLLIGGPLAYSHYRYVHFRNFRVVKQDVLYRSGQLSLPGFQRVVHDHGIRTVITLRDTSTEEEEWCQANDINYYRIVPGQWWSSDGPAPAEDSVRQFLAIMDNPANYPVLLHCFAGAHRTGAFCAVFRMEYEHWTNAEAMAEMKTCGYRNLDEEWDIGGFLENYRPRWR